MSRCASTPIRITSIPPFRSAWGGSAGGQHHVGASRPRSFRRQTNHESARRDEAKRPPSHRHHVAEVKHHRGNNCRISPGAVLVSQICKHAHLDAQQPERAPRRRQRPRSCRALRRGPQTRSRSSSAARATRPSTRSTRSPTRWASRSRRCSKRRTKARGRPRTAKARTSRAPRSTRICSSGSTGPGCSASCTRSGSIPGERAHAPPHPFGVEEPLHVHDRPGSRRPRRRSRSSSKPATTRGTRARSRTSTRRWSRPRAPC